MTGREAFKIWAPTGIKWTDWIRPVPFVAIDKHIENYEFYNFTIPNINYINKLETDTAVIIDISGYDSIKEGIALAKIGFRPIPIYNGTNEQQGAKATTNNHIIGPALIWGALELTKITINSDTSPVFLLDSNRMHRLKINDSIFDNSWDIYAQDLPTAEYFLKNGINKIIVRGESMIQKDLKKILYKFQTKKIDILFTNGYEEPKKVVIKKTKEK